MILGKGGISATVVADSINIFGDRLTTLKLHYHRFIHAEFLRHRMFSHSVSSSRAIPVKDMIAQLKQMPATPIYWGENKSGMSANKEIENIEGAKITWELASLESTRIAERFEKINSHKQITNRVLEPFQFINQVVSATDWDNFFYLRIHPDAQPEIQELAKCMYEAMNLSTPVLRRDSYHLPFIDDEMLHKNGIDDSIKISASVCAQASYRKEDYSIGKAKMIYDKLVNSRPLHASPFEHIAKPFSEEEHMIRRQAFAILDGNGIDGTQVFYNGNFKGWNQERKNITDETCYEFKS